LAVVLVPVIARLVFKEAVPQSTWLALPIACCGLALLSLNQELKLETAQLLLLAAASLFAIYFNLNARAANPISQTGRDGLTLDTPQVPVLLLTTLVLTVVGLVTGIFSALTENWEVGKLVSAPMVWLWVMLSATIGTAMRFYIQTYAQSLSPYSNGVVIMVLEPVWTALIAAMWFKESMSAIQLVGCLLIFLALIVNRWRAVQQFLRQILRK
jgi:drug/metabolite transporter (DMT)-like permease